MLAYGVLFLSTLVMPVNSILRKQYQKEQGIGMRSNLWFVGLYGLLAGCLTLAFSGFRLSLSGPVLLLGLAFALCANVTAVLCVVGPKFGNLSVLIMYALLGTLVLPALYSLLLEHQHLSAYKIVGLILALAILGLDFAESRKGKQSGALFKLFCVIVFFANGSLLILYKLIDRYFSECSLNGFISIWMFESAVVCLLVVALWPKSKRTAFESGRSRWVLPATYGLVVGVGEMLSAYCVPRIPTVVQSSVMFCFSLILTAVFDWVVYRQMPSFKGFIQLFLAMAGCVLFLL